MPTYHLFITDIFKSIQGEGPKIGTPSIFLRLGICNLQCIWCDTPYTWKKGMTDYKQQSPEWVIKKIQQLKKDTNIKNLVVTGGEPLLQQAALAKLLSSKFFKDMEIEFETNGSMPLLPEFKVFLGRKPLAPGKPNLVSSKITFNISPKLIDSGNKPYSVQIYPNSIFKFVYVSRKSESFINAFLKKYAKQIKKNPIYIMPEGTTVAAMQRNDQNIMRYCTRRGFIFTPRLHIYLFGDKRAT